MDRRKKWCEDSRLDMAASGEISPLSTEAKWGDNAVHLKDFAAKHPLPNLIKITKGQYRNIGVAKNVYSELYIHSIRTSKKVLAEGIKIKEGRRGIQTIDQKFSLPLSYQGWFELLSEDGKPIKAILSVQELVKVFPTRALVRENIKGFLPNENGELTVDKSRVVHTGEQLTLVGEAAGPFTTPKGIFKKKLLKCVDMKEELVYFLFEQKGLFSPIAGSGNISGVHNIKGLLEKFRMPIMVRLVHGIIPTRMDKNSFTGVFRLLSLYTDETAFVCPLKREAKMVPISTREPLKILAVSNLDNIRDLEESKYYHQRCTKMIASYNNSIHIMVSMPDQQSLEKGKRELQQLEKERQKQIQQSRPSYLPVGEEDILFEEVDDIYQYVRDGGPPPPPRPRPGIKQTNGTAGGWPLSKKQPKQSSKKEKVTSSTPSPKKSPPVKSNPPPPVIDRSQDEDYWEEPIYDDIQKFQKRKSGENLASSGENVSADASPENKKGTKSSSFAAKLAKFKSLGSKDKEEKSSPRNIPEKKLERPVSMDSNNQGQSYNKNRKNSEGDKYRSSDSLNKLSESPKEAKSHTDVAEYIRQLTIPASNLRKMQKNKTDDDQENTGSGSRTGSYVDRLGSSEEDLMDKSDSSDAPKVPPKRVDSNTHGDSIESIPSPASRSSTGSPTTDGSKPAEVRVIPTRNVFSVSTPVSAKPSQPLPNNAKVNIILPSRPPQQHSNNNAVQSQQNVSTASTTAPNMVYNRVSNQISISTPTRMNKPPQTQRYVAVARVGPEGESQRSPENINVTGARKMQSLYL